MHVDLSGEPSWSASRNLQGMLGRPRQGGWGAAEGFFHAFLREGPRSLGHEIVDQNMGCATLWLLGLGLGSEIPLTGWALCVRDIEIDKL